MFPLSNKFTSNTLIETFNELSRFTGFTYMAENAFKNCTKLREVELPSTLIGTGVSSSSAYGGAFYKTALTTINLKNVTRIGADTFYACPYLSSIDLKKIKYVGGNAFRNTLVLTKIILPNIVSGTSGNFQTLSLAYGSLKLNLVDFGPNMVGCGQYIRYKNNADYGYSASSSAWANTTVVFRSKSFVLTSKNALQHIYRCYCTEEMYDYLKSSINNSYTGIVYLIGSSTWESQFGSSDPFANLTQEEYDYYYKDIVENT